MLDLPGYVGTTMSLQGNRFAPFVPNADALPQWGQANKGAKFEMIFEVQLM